MIDRNSIDSISSHDTLFEVLLSSRHVLIGFVLVVLSWICELIRISYKLDHWFQHEVRMQSMTIRRRHEIDHGTLSPCSRNRMLYCQPVDSTTTFPDISPCSDAYGFFIPVDKDMNE
jgi:hypothetical protein